MTWNYSKPNILQPALQLLAGDVLIISQILLKVSKLNKHGYIHNEVNASMQNTRNENDVQTHHMLQPHLQTCIPERSKFRPNPSNVVEFLVPHGVKFKQSWTHTKFSQRPRKIKGAHAHHDRRPRPYWTQHMFGGRRSEKPRWRAHMWKGSERQKVCFSTWNNNLFALAVYSSFNKPDLSYCLFAGIYREYGNASIPPQLLIVKKRNSKI